MERNGNEKGKLRLRTTHHKLGSASNHARAAASAAVSAGDMAFSARGRLSVSCAMCGAGKVSRSAGCAGGGVLKASWCSLALAVVLVVLVVVLDDLLFAMTLR